MAGLCPFLIVIHVFICVFLILLVLIQNDKGGGLAGALGGMGSGAAFTGSSAATIITKLTTWTALVLFMVIMLLNVLSTKRSQMVVGESELKENPRSDYGSIFPEGYSSSTGVVPGLEEAPVDEGMGDEAQGQSGAAEGVPGNEKPAQGQPGEKGRPAPTGENPSIPGLPGAGSE